MFMNKNVDVKNVSEGELKNHLWKEFTKSIVGKAFISRTGMKRMLNKYIQKLKMHSTNIFPEHACSVCSRRFIPELSLKSK